MFEARFEYHFLTRFYITLFYHDKRNGMSASLFTIKYLFITLTFNFSPVLPHKQQTRLKSEINVSSKGRE